MQQSSAARHRIFHVIILLLLPAGAALAQPRAMEATGTSLAIEGLCARNVTIQPDPSLTGKYAVLATADHPEEVAQLRFDSGATAKLHGPEDECWNQSDRSFTRTLDIAIRVPAHVALAIEESGGAKYVLGDIGGALTLDISGGVAMQAASATEVTLDLSGGGDITISRIDGSMKADISGGGGVRIDRASMPNLELSLSGGGNFTLEQGTVKTLALDVSGAGRVKIGDTAGDTTIAVSGAGNVELAKVIGSISKDVDGSGSVTIGATQ